MKRKIFVILPIFVLVFLVVITLLPSTKKTSTVKADSLTLTANDVKNLTFKWVNDSEIDMYIPGNTSPVVQFINSNAMDDYWATKAGGSPGFYYAFGSSAVGNTCSGPYDSGNGMSYIEASSGNPKVSAYLENIYYTLSGSLGGTCSDVAPGNIAVSDAQFAPVMYSYANDGSGDILRVDGNTDWTYTPTKYTGLYQDSSGAACSSEMIDNTPGTTSTSLNIADIYMLFPEGLPATAGPAAPSNLYATGCDQDSVINLVSNDIEFYPGPVLEVCTSGFAGIHATCQSNSFDIVVDADKDGGGYIPVTVEGMPTNTTNPSGGTSGSGSSTGTTCASDANLYAASTPDSCIMPSCNLSGNPLTWIICPIVTAGEKLVGQLDNGINAMLNVNTCQYFANINTACTGASNGTTSGDFFTAWASFRDIALGVVVIAVLIMIIAQAISVEAVSAYTFKKMMPRVLIVIIGISLSWYLLEFAVQVSDDLGNGIRFLIESPFANISNHQMVLGGAGAAVGDLLVLGAGFALGIIGLLTLVLTAAIAVISGFALLLFRNLSIIVFIVLAPVAIACYALPNTQRIWKLWSSNFIKVLVMFPIIAAFIASGRILAAILYTDNNTLDQLMAFVVYFAPYFMIPTAFKLAGGTMAMAGNVAANARKRVSQPVAGARQAIRKDRAERARNGNLFRGDGGMAQRMSRLSQGVMLANQAGLDPRKMRGRLRSARSSRISALSGKVGESDAARAIFSNDDLLAASLHGNRTEADARNYLMERGQTGPELDQNVASITQARRDVGRVAFEDAAAAAIAGTGTGYADGPAQMLDTIGRVAGNDSARATRILASARSQAERAKRVDLYGAGFGTSAEMMSQLRSGQTDAATVNQVMTDEALNSKSAGEIGSSRNNAVTNMVGAIQRRMSTAQYAVDVAQSQLTSVQASGNPQRMAQAEDVLRTAQHEQKRVYASTSAFLDSATHFSPENAHVVGALMGQRTSDGRTVGQVIKGLEGDNNDVEYQQYKKVFATGTAANSAQSAEEAANIAQQSQPPPEQS